MKRMLAAAAGLLAILAGCEAGDPADVTFTFAPPPGLEFTELTDTSVSHAAGTRVFARISSKAKYRVAVTRPSGWKVAFETTVSELDVKRNGQRVLNPKLDAAKGASYRIEVFDGGDFAGDEGLYEFTRNVRDGLAVDPDSSGARRMTRSEVTRSAGNDWFEKAGFLAGKTARLGDALEMTSILDLPSGGETTYRTELILERWDDCGASRCLWIRFTYLTDPSAVEALVGRPVEGLDLLLGPQARGITLRDLWVEGGGERLIDPATLLFHAETRDRTIGLEMEVPGRGALVLETDLHQVTRYRYPDSP